MAMQIQPNISQKFVRNYWSSSCIFKTPPQSFFLNNGQNMAETNFVGNKSDKLNINEFTRL